MFVNPLTVLGFIHTTKQEGHKAIVHTAAASQLGRMLVKQCKEEGIPLVNIVRKEEGVEVLKAIGAEFVVNSSLPSFREDLLAAVKATGATVAFDATGGGTLAMDILTAFDTSLRQLYPDQVHPAYGPAMVRTVYKYGGLDKKKQRVPAVCWRGQLVLGWLADALPFRQVWGGAPRCVHQKGSDWLEDDLLDVLWHQLVLWRILPSRPRSTWPLCSPKRTRSSLSCPMVHCRLVATMLREIRCTGTSMLSTYFLIGAPSVCLVCVTMFDCSLSVKQGKFMSANLHVSRTKVARTFSHRSKRCRLDTFPLRSVSAHQAEYLSLKEQCMAIDCYADDPCGLQQQVEAELDDR